MTKNIIYVLGAIVIAGAILGAYLFPVAQTPVAIGTSPTGTTFSSQKIAAIAFVPSAAGATTTSILNTDANDRYVTSNFVNCTNATTSYTAITGGGLANLIIKAATTSTNAPAVVGNTNLAMNDTVATGTSAAGGAAFPVVMVSSTSLPASPAVTNNVGAGAFAFLWASGSYLSFWANATNTAACIVGVQYSAS